eukprot:39652_1
MGCVSNSCSSDTTPATPSHISPPVPSAINTTANYSAIARQMPTPATIPETFNSASLRTLLPSKHCDINTCAAMIRLRYILSHDETDIASYGAYELINHHLNEYSTVRLLDDYHHLLSAHDHEFEEIYNNLIPCSVNTCSSYTRNHRDRSSINNRDKYNSFVRETKNRTNDRIKAINTMQIIDQIHCYFLHTFDALYRLNRNDQTKLTKRMELMLQKEKETDEKETDVSIIESDDNDDKEEHMSLRVRAMSQHMEDVTNTQRKESSSSRRSSRFSRVTNTQKRGAKYCRLERELSRGKSQQMNETDIDTKMMAEDKPHNAVHDIVYSFGVRFEYDKSKKHHQWYVKPKRQTLKDELVNNEWRSFNMESWREVYESALHYAQTRRIKEEYVLHDTGDIPSGVSSVMSVDNLIALMVYCNFDKLQAEFSASYRILQGESAMDLKQRHSEWHQLGKYLRQTVEYFGKRISSVEQRIRNREVRRSSYTYVSGKLKFFHGINKEMVFVSTSAKICGPLSTSSESFVALSFAGSDGLLLELTGTNARFFDCCGLSDFSNEKEALFLGGYDPLLIYTVINPRTIDYRKYIKAINIISCLFNGSPYYGPAIKPLSKHTMKRVYTLLFAKQQQHNIEPYVERLFTHYTENVKQVVIDWKLMTMEHDEMDQSIKGFKFIKNMICMKTFHWIKMNRIQILFKHLEVIQVNYIQLSKQVIEYIMHVLTTKKQTTPLHTIRIYQPFQRYGLTIPDALATYADTFRQQLKWYIQAENDINLVIKKLLFAT